MTLRTKFVVVLFLFWVAVCLNIYAAIYYSDVLLGRAAAAFETRFPAILTVESAEELLEHQHLMLLETVSSQPAAAPDFAEIRDLAIEISAYTRRLDRLPHDIPSWAILSDLRRSLSAYQQKVLQYVSLCEIGTDARDRQNLWVASAREYQDLTRRIQLTLEELNASQVQDARDAHAAATNVNHVLFGMACAELILLIVTLSFFLHWMLKPIEAIRKATEQIAAGNLNYRLELTRRDELGALAAEVNHMAESLARAQQQLQQKERMAAMGEMVSVVAHNIRNPLAGIRATAQTSLHELSPGGTVHQQQQRIIETVDSLEQWLKELLHLNRPIDLHLEPTNLDEVIADLQHIFQPTTQRKGLRVEYVPVKPDQQVSMDRRHFVQALASLLDNAIEASPAGSTVQIRAGTLSPHRDRFYLEITDHGSGVPQALRQQIFEPYFSTKPGGTGIGLSMAKKIVEAHSGRITIQNGCEEEGGVRGTTFRIEIPNRLNRAEGHADGQPADR